jgi:hypothetical protein
MSSTSTREVQSLLRHLPFRETKLLSRSISMLSTPELLLSSLMVAPFCPIMTGIQPEVIGILSTYPSSSRLVLYSNIRFFARVTFASLPVTYELSLSKDKGADNVKPSQVYFSYLIQYLHRSQFAAYSHWTPPSQSSPLPYLLVN